MVAPEPALLEQLATALNIYNDLDMRAGLDEAEAKRQGAPLGISSIQYQKAGAFVAAAVSAIENATGRTSTRSQYARHFAEEYDTLAGGISPSRARSISSLKGIVEETHAAILKGHLLSYEELIRGELFSDVLEMADHLQTEGYKDPAAVIAGTALELHLKKLCAKHTVPVVGNAARMNDDLKKASVYGALEQKQIAAWQQLRNDAAHGNYAAVDAEQVDLMIKWVRGFIADHLA